jgi:hypothetical protein
VYALLGASASGSPPTHLLVADGRTGHPVTVVGLPGHRADLFADGAGEGHAGAGYDGLVAGADHQLTLFTSTHLYLLTGSG